MSNTVNNEPQVVHDGRVVETLDDGTWCNPKYPDIPLTRIRHRKGRKSEWTFEWVPTEDLEFVTPVQQLYNFLWEAMTAPWRHCYYRSVTDGLRYLVTGSYSDTIPRGFERRAKIAGVEVFCKRGVDNRGKDYKDRTPFKHRIGFVCPLCGKEIPAGRASNHLNSKSHREAMTTTFDIIERSARMETRRIGEREDRKRDAAYWSTGYHYSDGRESSHHSDFDQQDGQAVK